MTLPRPFTDACEILLLLKDNLAGHHRELVDHLSLKTSGGAGWADGPRKSISRHRAREYLVVTREVDPTANEEARVHYVTKGYRAELLAG